MFFFSFYKVDLHLASSEYYFQHYLSLKGETANP